MNSKLEVNEKLKIVFGEIRKFGRIPVPLDIYNHLCQQFGKEELVNFCYPHDDYSWVDLENKIHIQPDDYVRYA